MIPQSKTSLVLGLGIVALGLLAIFYWIPADTGTGIVEKSRGKLKVGDALAPTVAFSLLVLSGLLLIWEHWRGSPSIAVPSNSYLFSLIILALFGVSLLLMRWTGPLIVDILSLGVEDDLQYRELRDTAPWKYIGYLSGGTVLITASISIASRQLRPLYLLIGFIFVCAMIAVYDLPFEDLLLPPNGDV